jgi:hypothetical protein
VHYREEPSVEIAVALPAMLRYRADESVLDEIIGPEHIVGQRAGITSQTRDFFSRSQLKSFILTVYVLRKYRPGAAPERRAQA